MSVEDKYKTWKYNGNRYREPWWFPELEQRRMRYKMFDDNLNGAGYHFAENESYADQGAKQMLGAVCQLLLLMHHSNPSCTVLEAVEYIKQSIEEVEKDSLIKPRAIDKPGG